MRQMIRQRKTRWKANNTALKCKLIGLVIKNGEYGRD
jgi:hypothetical protein